MNKFWSSVHAAISHPLTTLGGLFVSIGGVVGLLSTIQSTAETVASTPHASVHIIQAASQTEATLTVAIAIGSGLAALGQSLIKDAGPHPPPTEGAPTPTPFPQSGVLPQSSLSIQQKEAA